MLRTSDSGLFAACVSVKESSNPSRIALNSQDTPARTGTGVIVNTRKNLKSGDLSDVAYVLKELFLIGKDKELSFGERRLLEQAMGLVSMELAYSMDRDQELIKEDINEMFADVIAAQEERA